MMIDLRKLLVVLLSAGSVFVASSYCPLIAADPAVTNQAVKPSKSMKEVAGLTVANELMRLHWTSWVSGRELKEIAKAAATEINERVGKRAEVEFILPEVLSNRRRLDSFEKRALGEIRAGVPKVWREIGDGMQLIGGIRATTACIQCHQPMGAPSDEPMEGDLLGVVSLRLKH